MSLLLHLEAGAKVEISGSRVQELDGFIHSIHLNLISGIVGGGTSPSTIELYQDAAQSLDTHSCFEGR